jgi:hypothetical protein
MNFHHNAPEFPFSSLKGISPSDEEHTAVWSESANHGRPSAVPNPIVVGPVDALSSGTPKFTQVSVSQDVYTPDLLGDQLNGEPTFSDATGGAVAPARDVRLWDLLRRLDELEKVSIQCWIVDQGHRLTFTGYLLSTCANAQ